MHDVKQLAQSPKLVAPTSGYIRKPGDFIGTHYVPSPPNDVPVQAHLLMLRSPQSLNTPRIFVRQGGPGLGKTTSLANAVLAIPNTALMLVPPGAFGSPNEGGGVENLWNLMKEACAYSLTQRHFIAVLFDDMDASELSHSDKTGHTTNPIATAGEIQNVAQDHTRFVDFTGKPVPILVSANAPKMMRPSMFRDMRAKITVHVDDPNAKLEMVIRAFAPQGQVERGIVDRLFKAHAANSMAWWKALYADWQNVQGEDAIRKHGPDPAAFNAAVGQRVPLNEAKLTALANARKNTKLGDYLSFITGKKGS